MTGLRVPDDFPREPNLGSVTGVQPKLLVREVEGRYQSGLTEEEIFVRYDDVCEDLAAQVPRLRRAEDFDRWYVPRCGVEKGVRLKGDSGEWDLSQADVAWVLKRTHQLLPT
jgi:hypothetical protein